MPRGRYEFDKRTKDEAFSRWHAENPGNEDANLEIHHRIPVHFAKKEGIPPDLVRTQDNAVAVTRDEHKEIHRNEPSDEEYKTLAQSILGWVGGLFG